MMGVMRLVLVSMAVLLMTGSCMSQGSAEEDGPGFPDGACGFRSWVDQDPAAVLVDPDNCDEVCDAMEYYSEEAEDCLPCDPGYLSIYGRALWSPVGEDSCQPEAICVEHEKACHKCGPVPFSGFADVYDRCECRKGFSVRREEVEGELFFVCKRDCEEENGGCDQRCEPGEEEGEEAECTCAEGFEKDDEECEDIDECMTGDNECRAPHQCQNRKGGYVCKCAPGQVSIQHGQKCTQAKELVCMISILEIDAPFEDDSKEEDFGELTDTEDEEYDEKNVEAMFREVVSEMGAWPREIKVAPMFTNGHLEFQVMMQFSPELDVEQETRLLGRLAERLARSGYTTNQGGNFPGSVYISRPVYCFSKSTGGIPLPIDDPCEWYDEAGWCLQNSQCIQDGGKPYCLCPDGWYGERCEIGKMTIVNIVLIVVVHLLFIMFTVLCCYVCMRWRRRGGCSCGCGKKTCCGKSKCGGSSHKVYASAQMTHLQQPFPAPIKTYQSGCLSGGTNLLTYG